jgi:hypothetical protein
MCTFPVESGVVEVVYQLKLEVVVNCQQKEVDLQQWNRPFAIATDEREDV